MPNFPKQALEGPSLLGAGHIIYVAGTLTQQELLFHLGNGGQLPLRRKEKLI